MKKLLLIIAAIITISSCHTVGIFHYAYDLRSYDEKGFLFTPSDFDKEYKSIGFFETHIKEPYGQVYSSEDYLTQIMENVKELGGDALTHLEIENVYKDNVRIGVIVTGFAIKRLD